ncbi:MAG: hypothetical protein H2212_10350 [Ruminococcus sp.]|jgi:hypothetical protein|nr:hypothetical protein [Ruminococcus sp.]
MPEIRIATSNPYIDARIKYWAASNGSTANSSNISVTIEVIRTNEWTGASYGLMNTSVKCNGETKNENNFRVSITNQSWVLIFAKAFTVKHNDNGTKTCDINISSSSDFGLSFSKQISYTLPTIPRYTSIKSFSAVSKTNSSITFNWSTADIISNFTCNFNGAQMYSSNTDTNSGSFTVGGLPENTTYSNITITVTRKDSGLTTTSSPIPPASTTWTQHTSNLALNSRGINSIALSWSSNYACDSICIYNGGTPIYSADGFNTTNGTVTLSPSNWSSIAPGKTYSLTINVRRKASQWWSMSGTISVTTLALPVVNGSTPNAFNIGNNLTVSVSNAANAAYSLIFQTYQSNWTTYKIVNVAQGTTNTTLSLTASDLYNMCPMSNTLATRVTCQVTVNSVTYPPNEYYYITANVTNSNPTFSDFMWETNVGTNINNIISGTTNMITGYGGLRLKFAANSAAAVNSASVVSLETKILFSGSVITTGTIPYSSSAFNFDISTTNITTAGTYTIQINALDSRKNRSGVVSYSFTVFAYKKPSISASMYRFNNFEQATLISLTGNIAKTTVSGVQKNAITSLKYRYTESGTPYPNTYENLTEYTTSNITGTDNLLLTFNKTDSSNPFKTLAYEKSYIFQFVLTDKMEFSTVFEVFVAQGTPLMSVSEDGYVGIGMIPDFESASKLQVSTDIMANGKNILTEIDKKFNTANVVNNLTTTAAGYALDARQCQALNASISTLSNTASGLSTTLSNLSTTVSGKAPTNHASSGTGYGVGSTANYGHVKTRNDLNASAYAAGEALSAYQGYVLNQKLPDSGWKLLLGNGNSGESNNGISYRLKNGFVTLVINLGGSTNITIGTNWTYISTLPGGYRPSINIQFAGKTPGTSNTQLWQINTEGLIYAAAVSSSVYSRASITFPVN